MPYDESWPLVGNHESADESVINFHDYQWLGRKRHKMPFYWRSRPSWPFDESWPLVGNHESADESNINFHDYQ